MIIINSVTVRFIGPNLTEYEYYYKCQLEIGKIYIITNDKGFTYSNPVLIIKKNTESIFATRTIVIASEFKSEDDKRMENLDDITQDLIIYQAEVNKLRKEKEKLEETLLEYHRESTALQQAKIPPCFRCHMNYDYIQNGVRFNCTADCQSLAQWFFGISKEHDQKNVADNNT